jgi:hypothetical protein
MPARHDRRRGAGGRQPSPAGVSDAFADADDDDDWGAAPGQRDSLSDVPGEYRLQKVLAARKRRQPPVAKTDWCGPGRGRWPDRAEFGGAG